MANDEYAYAVIDNEDDARLCAQLIADVFSAENPITIFDGISPKRFFDECSWPLAKSMFGEKLSFLARHRASGKIIAAAIAGDLHAYHQQHPFDSSTPPQTIPITDLLEEMDHLFITRDFGQKLEPHLVLHITVAAVHHQHSGKGVATQLNKAMCTYARDQQQFKYALVQVTNPATRFIYLNKMKGTEVTIVDPTVWEWKKKGGDRALHPYQDYKGESIPNILLEL